MTRPRHPDKDIESALLRLEAAGWQVAPAKGRSAHAWGFVLCPENAKDACRGGVFCRMSVWSTPRNPANHARDLERNAQGCVIRTETRDD